MALIQENWTVHSEPGEPVCFEKNGRRLEAFMLVEKIGPARIDGGAVEPTVH
jgi:hypothetical protein